MAYPWHGWHGWHGWHPCFSFISLVYILDDTDPYCTTSSSTKNTHRHTIFCSYQPWLHRGESYHHEQVDIETEEELRHRFSGNHSNILAFHMGISSGNVMGQITLTKTPLVAVSENVKWGEHLKRQMPKKNTVIRIHDEQSFGYGSKHIWQVNSNIASCISHCMLIPLSTSGHDKPSAKKTRHLADAG